jgi:hypothetical protein
MSNEKDTLRKEYPEHLIKSGVRGKYANLYRKGSKLVVDAPSRKPKRPRAGAK